MNLQNYLGIFPNMGGGAFVFLKHPLNHPKITKMSIKLPHKKRTSDFPGDSIRCGWTLPATCFRVTSCFLRMCDKH